MGRGVADVCGEVATCTTGGGEERTGNRIRRREVLFIVNLFITRTHGIVRIQASATGCAKRVQKTFIKRINRFCTNVWTGGERLWSRCFGGEEGLPPRTQTAVNPLASVIELYIVGASVDAEATNPSIV